MSSLFNQGFTLPKTNPWNVNFEDDYPFPKVGYVSVPWRVSSSKFGSISSQMALDFWLTSKIPRWPDITWRRLKNPMFINAIVIGFFPRNLHPRIQQWTGRIAVMNKDSTPKSLSILHSIWSMFHCYVMFDYHESAPRGMYQQYN